METTTYMDNDDLKSALWMVLLFVTFIGLLMATGLLEFSDADDRAIGTGTTAQPVK